MNDKEDINMKNDGKKTSAAEEIVVSSLAFLILVFKTGCDTVRSAVSYAREHRDNLRR